MQTPELKDCVILGYTDITAAGSRALLGLDLEKFTIFPLLLKSLTNYSSRPASFNKSMPELDEMVLVGHHNNRDVSFIIINTIVPPRQSHIVASEIMDLLTKNKVKEFIILSTLSINSASSYVKIIDRDIDHDLTSKFSCTDPFLNSLLQFVKIETFATLLIAVDGRKAKEGSRPNTSDGSQKAIEVLLQFLGGELELDLKSEQSLSWVFCGDYPSATCDANMYI